MKTIVKLDLDKKPWEQEGQIHNRWHPDIPFLTSVKPGEEILIESLDFLDAQIKDTDDVSDVKNVDLTRAHPLTGPFYVEGAEPVTIDLPILFVVSIAL